VSNTGVRFWVGAAACLVVIACGSKRPVVPAPPDLSGLEQADAQILQGCYDCLLDAQAIYRRIGRGTGRPLVLTKLFETSLLIALRHKELALDPSEPLAEARAIASELAPEVEADRYLTLVDAVPPDDVGTPRRTMAGFRRAQATFVSKVDSELTWLTTGTLREPFRQYLGLAIDCGYAPRARTPGAPPRPTGVRQPPAGAPPLIAYRTATCATLNQPILYRLRADHPRFVEASLFLARFDIAMAEQLGPGQAFPRLEESRARFPASVAASYLSGSINQAIGDCDAALAFYDEAIALAPLHEDAVLGRTICLTYVKRHEEAIESATRLISSETTLVSDGYYWRAFNRHVRKELESARADIERAKALRRNIETSTLAGIIEYDQDDLDLSKRDLEVARKDSTGDMNCTAIFYLALLHLKRQDSPTSARLFEDGMSCYERGAAIAGLKLQEIEARQDLEPVFRARKIAMLRDAIREATSQRYACAFNAANYYAVASNIPAAKRLVEIAAADPALAEKVSKLKEWLKDK